MSSRLLIVGALSLVLAAPAALALNPDDELWIPAAARGEGNAGSFWMTDLAIMNLGAEAVTVELTWLPRGEDNGAAEGLPYEVAAGETLVLADVVNAVFGQEEAAGAIHVEVEEEGGDKGAKQADPELVATARIYNLDEGETFGQGFEGIVDSAAISAGGRSVTHVIGVTDNASFRSNWYGLNITEDSDTDLPGPAEVVVDVLDLSGAVLASRTYSLLPYSPVLNPVAEIGAGSLDNASLRFTMLAGKGIFGVSKVDQLSNDPTTLEAYWKCDSSEGEPLFTDQFFTERCTFATSGANPFFPLEVGFQQVLEGEEEGEVVRSATTVLDETFEVAGVLTRVVEERETVDGELEEVSRNYMAHCVETGSVFYFGEDVDNYEDGVVVNHDGSWHAGVDSARAGIIMPGTILLGARYFQEIAPGVALDRGEHTRMGIAVETDAGAFTDCIEVLDTDALEPGGAGDIKVYCPDIGVVQDEDLLLVEYNDPTP